MYELPCFYCGEIVERKNNLKQVRCFDCRSKNLRQAALRQKENARIREEKERKR